MTTIAVIPARYHSQRFPGKPLADLGGKPLIYWCWHQTRQCQSVDRVLVATDDERIAKAVREFGGEVAMTSPDAPSGSDRIAEAVRDLDCNIVVNVQGDEPDIDPRVIGEAIQTLAERPECRVSTARVPIRTREDFESPDVVKVVCDEQDRALYFSRSPLPNRSRSAPDGDSGAEVWGFKHLGMYVYRKEALLEFTQWPPTMLERQEKLEQLRFLEHGVKIVVVEASRDCIGVDTPEELEQLRRRWNHAKISS